MPAPRTIGPPCPGLPRPDRALRGRRRRLCRHDRERRGAAGWGTPRRRASGTRAPLGGRNADDDLAPDPPAPVPVRRVRPVPVEPSESRVRRHGQPHQRVRDRLRARYPALRAALDEAIAAFNELLEARPLKYHLGSIASLEATFTPTMKARLDNREVLSTTGDMRVASLFVWHFVEEIEHRSSELPIYDTIVGEPWYRLRNAWTVRAQVQRTFLGITKRFAQGVPPADHGVEIAGRRPTSAGFRSGSWPPWRFACFSGSSPGTSPRTSHCQPSPASGSKPMSEAKT